MPTEITMPKLTDTMTEATLAKWLKKEGDQVQPGDMIAEVETDKATQELEVFEPGTIAKIVVPEGGKTPVGALIVVLAKPGEDVKKVAAGAKASNGSAGAGDGAGRAAAQKRASANSSDQPAASVAVEDHNEGSEPEVLHTGKVRVSPLARKVADEKGVDVSTLRGSGPDGRIIKRDVLDAAARLAPVRRPPPGTVKAFGPSTAAQAAPSHLAVKLERKNIPLSNMRQTIARRLVQSKQTIPHFYVSIDIVMDRLIDLRAGLNEHLSAQGEKISITDLVARGVAIAVTRVPAVNTSFAETTIIQHGTVDLGIAVALEDGLVVPVVRDAQDKSVRQLSQEIRLLADLGRARKLKAEQMTGSTFTISNLGMYGIKGFSAIINPPETAILAVGGTSWQPVVREAPCGGVRAQQVVPAQVMNLTLSADHRAVDGATGAKFLQELKTILESPVALLL